MTFHDNEASLTHIKKQDYQSSLVNDVHTDEGYVEQRFETPDFMAAWSDEMKAEFAYQLLLSIPTSRTRNIVGRLTPLLHRDFLGLLPYEIALHILCYVDVPTLAQVVRVSRRWKELSEDQTLWKYLYQKKGWRCDQKNIDAYLTNTHPHSSPLSSHSSSPTPSPKHSRHKSSRNHSTLPHLPDTPESSSRTPITSIPLTRTTAPLYNAALSPLHDTPLPSNSSRLRSIRRPGDFIQRLRYRRHLQLAQINNTGTENEHAADTETSNESLLASLSGSLLSSHSSLAKDYKVSMLASSAANVHTAAPSSHSRSQPLMSSHRSTVSNYPLTTIPSARSSFSTTPRQCTPSTSTHVYRSFKNRPIARKNVKYDETALYHYKEETDQRFINWRRLYRNRSLVEKRWRDGKCKMRVFPPHDTGDMHSEGIYCIQFDNDKLVSASRDRTIKLWDIRTGECRQTLVAHSQSVLCLQYNDDYIISGSGDKKIIQWDIRTGEIIRTMLGHGDSVLNLRFSEHTMVSCSKDKTLRVWDLETGVTLRKLQGHRAAVNAVQFKDHLIVSASGDRTIKLWDMTTGDCLRTFDSHSRGIACVEFDGERIVSGSCDQTIKIWNATTGECLHTLAGHTNLVRTLQVDALSDRIVSGSYDGSLKVWGLNHGAMLLSLSQAIEGRVLNLRYDYARIVCCSNLPRIVIYDFAHGIDTQFLM